MLVAKLTKFTDEIRNVIYQMSFSKNYHEIKEQN